MQKILVIAGPTSTGKTKLGIYLAKKFEGEVVSADSRQVYIGMDIGTGKDLPKGGRLKKINSILPGYYEIEGIKVWGLDLVDPKKSFSVAQYAALAGEIIDNILSRKKLPIIVGGTGLYIKAVVDGIETSGVARNPKLRSSLSEKGREELFEILAQIDSSKAASLNTSDAKNPRRLMRAIEVALAGSKNTKTLKPRERSILFVGLSASKEEIGKRIEKRVEQRLEGGLKKEIEKLLARGVSFRNQSMSSLGYRQWEPFYKKKEKEGAVIAKWIQEEKKYAKRQMTWFKKEKRINWFEITNPSWQENVEKTVKKWYINPSEK